MVRRTEIELLLSTEGSNRATVRSAARRLGATDHRRQSALRASPDRCGGSAGVVETGEPQGDPPDREGQRLATSADAAWQAAACQWVAFDRGTAESALDRGCDARLLRSRWLVSLDGDH